MYYQEAQLRAVVRKALRDVVGDIENAVADIETAVGELADAAAARVRGLTK